MKTSVSEETGKRLTSILMIKPMLIAKRKHAR